MKIWITRTGGLAGIEEVTHFDTEAIDPSSAKELEALIDRSGFFSYPALVESSQVGADFFRYEVAVTSAGRTHTVTFQDDTSPETAPLRNLVAQILRSMGPL